MESAKHKFLGSGTRIKGKIHSWKSKQGYGFVKPGGEAEPLGNLFVHVTDMLNNASAGKWAPKNHKWIEFNAEEEPGKTSYRAKNVLVIDSTPPGEGAASNGNHAEQGGGRGGRGGARGR